MHRGSRRQWRRRRLPSPDKIGVVRRQAEENAAVKKQRGRKPAGVDPVPDQETKANTTDPDSRIMKTRQGYLQGYNVQAVVSEDQVVLAVGVTQDANDMRQLKPMVDRLEQTLN
jgi:hypothetical protein